MAGFVYRRREGANSSAETRDFVIGNSKTITIGDAVRLAGGTGANYIDLVTAGVRVLGVVTGFVDNKGLPLDAQHADFDGTHSGNPGVVGSETYVSASDNATDKKIKARVIIDPHAEYYNDGDEAFVAGDEGLYCDVLAASDQIDSSTKTTTGQFVLMEIDPDNELDLSEGTFRIAEHALQLG